MPDAANSGRRDPWFRRPWALELVGAGALLLVLLVVGVTTLFNPEDAGDVKQAEGRLEISVVKPTATAPFDRTFDWQPIEGATTYRVLVFTSDGARSFEVRDLKTTSVALSPTVKLAPGRYFWQVIATRDGETLAESPRTPFDLK